MKSAQAPPQPPDQAVQRERPPWEPDAPRLRLSPYALYSLLLVVGSVFVYAVVYSWLARSASSELSDAVFTGVFIALAVVLLAMGIAGIVFGHMGRHQARDWPAVYRGRWLATVGLILGYPLAFLWLGLLLLGIAFSTYHGDL